MAECKIDRFDREFELNYITFLYSSKVNCVKFRHPICNFFRSDGEQRSVMTLYILPSLQNEKTCQAEKILKLLVFLCHVVLYIWLLLEIIHAL